MIRFLIMMLAGLLILHQNVAAVKEINPSPVLTIEGLGNGYSTPAVTSDRIFVTGEHDGLGCLFAYDLQGNLAWKTNYGSEWTENFPGSRSTPSVADSSVYISSGMGDIGCFDIKTGEKKWNVNMIREMHGINAVFGYSVPVLVNNDRIYCLPGGQDTNIACLNRFNGKIIWISKGVGETPGYASPLLIIHHGRNILVTYTELSLLGLDADTGELLWTYELSIKGDAPCNNLIYSDGFLYAVAGGNNGAVKLEISENGTTIKKIWENKDFDTYFGGFVRIGKSLYGSSKNGSLFQEIDTETGNRTDSLSFKTGATVDAGAALVLYSQGGKVGMVNTDNGKMKLVSTFMITKGTKEHFSHPVVAGERLYIRHGDVLLGYDFRQLTDL